MTSPFTGGQCTLKNEVREVTYRKEKFEYVAQFWVCNDTGEEFTTSEQDGASIAQVYNRYREKYGIPYVDEIVGLRKRYGLSCASMSAILGFGPNQWRLYEQGEVPSVSNGRMIRSAMNPMVMLDLIENAGNCISESERKNIKKKVEDAAKAEDSTIIRKYKESRIFIHKRGATNGYAPESLERLKNILLYVLDRCGDVWYTKMNKILFYIDFLSYREHGIALTGLTYRAIGFGPVPEKWERVFSEFDAVQQVPKAEGEYEGCILTGMEKPNLEAFSIEERIILDKVCDKFKDTSARTISTISHNEDAWKDCHASHALIPYSKAFNLKAF